MPGRGRLTAVRHAIPAIVITALSGCPAARRPSPPPPPPPVEVRAESWVLFVVEPGEKHHRLAPLICSDEGRLQGGARCERLAGRVPSVTLEGARRARVLGSGSVACAGQERPALLVAAREYEQPGFAAWPAKALARIEPTVPSIPGAGAPGKPGGCRGWCRFTRTGHRRVRVTPEIESRLAAAVESAFGSRPAFQILQEVGAGTDERLHSVVVMDRTGDEYAFAFSALFLTRAPRDRKVRLLRREDGDAVVVRGTLDLCTTRPCDEPRAQSPRSSARRGFARSSRALWLLLTPFPGEGQAHEVLSLAGPRPEVVARRDCRVVGD